MVKEQTKFDINLLYDQYGGAIYGVIRRMISDEDLATEVLQDTFVKVWKYQEKYDPSKSSLFTWMMHIARNSAINTIQSKTQKNRAQTSHQDFSSTSMNHGITQQSIDTLDLGDKVEALDDKYKSVLKLVYYGGFTQAEASETLDIPIGTVKSRIKTALRILSEIYYYSTVSIIAIIFFSLKSNILS